MKPRDTNRFAAVTAALASAGVAALFAVAPASASTTCDRVAAANGSDSNPGTLDAPFRSAQKLVSSLQPGATGCLRAGGYSGDDEIKISVGGVTLTSYPGERATLAGRVYIPAGADGVTVSNLDLDGRNSDDLPSPTINADDVVLRGNDITNHHTEICVSVGSPDWGRADRTLIEGNRIHDCGELPATNMDHGIYVNSSDDAVIRGNLIYDNADRGIQLYPDAKRTTVTGNVIDGNGQGVIFGGNASSAATGNVVEHNVITNSKLRHNVESNWAGPVGSGNIARDNCVGGGAYDDASGGILGGGDGLGFKALDNLVEVPDYADPDNGDFTIPSSSPCAAVLAGGAATPPADPASAAPAAAAAVTIETSKSTVPRMVPVRVRGNARGAKSVTLVVRRDREWRRLARDRTSAKGSYRTTIKLRESGRETVKAVAGGLRDSKPVRLRVT